MSSDLARREKERLGAAGVALSLFLFGLKGIAALRSGSAAVLSDAFNAFLDVLTYSVAYVSIRIHEQRPDEDHPFGHRRAEPLAGMLFAVFASALGATVVRDALQSLLKPGTVQDAPLAAALLVASIAIKGAMAIWYYRGSRRTGSPALRASFVDSRNDVLTSGLALTGLLAGGRMDAIAALAIGAWIIISGVRVGLENVGYLMGNAPAPEVKARIVAAATAVPGVVGVHDVLAHYVGDRLHVQLHVELDGGLALTTAHAIGNRVREAVEAIELVQKAFVHLDPVTGDREPCQPNAGTPR